MLLWPDLECVVSLVTVVVSLVFPCEKTYIAINSIFYKKKYASGFIQESLSKFKDFSRTSQDYFTVFKDQKIR